MKDPILIMWFRNDLRLSDNPALLKASTLGSILPIYILDDLAPFPFKIGSASKSYLHYSLEHLNTSLQNSLNVYKGSPEKIILQLIQKYTISYVFWNRCYGPWNAVHDIILETRLKEFGIQYTVFNGAYLWSPENVQKEDGSYYKVFSAYKRKVYSMEPRGPLPPPKDLSLMKDHHNSTTLKDLNLICSPSWNDKIQENWTFGEEAAFKKLEHFLHTGLRGYKKGRDYPGRNQTSKLSVNLHFGEISPHHIWNAVKNIPTSHGFQEDIEHFLSELIWREFSCYLLTYYQELPYNNFQPKFNGFPWADNAPLLKAWQSGNTGYPIVDAGMRQLWQTGYMHNRVRMIVASFLVKNLMIHWHQGRDWFWECLVDGDLANNSASWQWVAGCGADAAPYFRIFNPILQGEKFDSNGDYTQTFVPELKNLPKEYLFKPWKAPETVLKNAGIILGQTYAYPIVDITLSRSQALEWYKKLSHQ